MKSEHLPNMSSPSRILVTVDQFCSRNPAFNIGGVRHWIFHAERNGFSACVRRVGRKILIDEDLAFQWIDSQNGGWHEIQN